MTELAGLSPAHFLWQVQDRVATIRLNRPDKNNAFNSQTIRELLLALDAVGVNPAVRLLDFVVGMLIYRCPRPRLSRRLWPAGCWMGKGAR